MIYLGPLNEKKMSKDARRAYDAWKNQRSRCTNPKNKSFRNYGTKKIKVLYQSREFIAWYLEELKTFQGVDPIVGRIDHDKDYSFDNIRLETRRESSLEMIDRNKRRKTVGVYDDSSKLLYIATSTCDAARFAGIKQGSVVERCKNYGVKNSRKSRSGYNFRYL